MRKGFTLLETLIALAIFTFLASIGVLLSTRMYQATLVGFDRDTVTALLIEARSNSLSSVDGRAWGVCADKTQKTYVLFTAPYLMSTQRTPYPMTAGVLASSSPSLFDCNNAGLVFSRLSATTSSTTLMLGQQLSTSTISINYEGTISF